MKNILIVCLGNICRSPMTEGLLRHNLSGNYPNVSISSAGITALVGKPADLSAQIVMKNKKAIDISAHRARQITNPMLIESDLILVMDNDQKKQIEFNFPSICGRVHRLGKWSGFDIPDPYKRSGQVFEQTLSLIEKCVDDWQTRLWK